MIMRSFGWARFGNLAVAVVIITSIMLQLVWVVTRSVAYTEAVQRWCMGEVRRHVS